MIRAQYIKKALFYFNININPFFNQDIAVIIARFRNRIESKDQRLRQTEIWYNQWPLTNCAVKNLICTYLSKKK